MFRSSKVLAGMLALIASGYSAAQTVEVGACSHFQQFSTIQSAVDGASAGSTVLVCPGTYAEQVTITKSLRLEAIALASGSGAVITVPAGFAANATSLSSGNPLAAQILVKNASDVRIRNLTINGANTPFADCSAPTFLGIFYQNSSGSIAHNALVNQALSGGATGCETGLAIFVQSGSGGSSDVDITDNVVSGYQKNGITGNEAGTRLNITNNNVIGFGPTNGAAENGIQIGFGASGKIVSNSVADNVWAPDTVSDTGDAASGILVYASKHVSVEQNTVNNSQFGIGVVSDSTAGNADGASISLNRVNGPHLFSGIEVCSNRNRVEGNSISSSDQAAIHLDSSCTGAGNSNVIRANVINSACAGVLEGSGTTSNNLDGNRFFNVTNTVLQADQCPAAPAAATASALTAAAVQVSQSPRRVNAVRP